MLSFAGGKPVARIIGGANDGRIVYLADTGGSAIPSDPILLLGPKFFQGKRKTDGRPLRQFDLTALLMALRQKSPPDDITLAEVFAEATKQLEASCRKEILDITAQFIPIPDFKTRETPFIAGPSGAGKSHYAAGYIEEIRRGRPSARFIVISRVKEDACIDKHKPARLSLESITEEAPPVEAFKDSVVLFDDVDCITDKKQLDAVTALRCLLLETGRHHNVYVISTAHQMSNYKATRVILNEASSITLFPTAVTQHHAKYFLNTYFGMDKNQVQKIRALPTRWVTIYKRFPCVCVHERGVYVV